MARGKQKEDAQKKNLKRQQEQKGAKSQIEARKAAFHAVCDVCKAPMTAYKQLVLSQHLYLSYLERKVEHMQAKHPGKPIPPEPQ
jgi:hypothetical protein